jgi:hypothetical protein
MSMPMLAGVGLMMVCCSSSSAAMMMMGGGDGDDAAAGAGAGAGATTPAASGLPSVSAQVIDLKLESGLPITLDELLVYDDKGKIITHNGSDLTTTHADLQPGWPGGANQTSTEWLYNLKMDLPFHTFNQIDKDAQFVKLDFGTDVKISRVVLINRNDGAVSDKTRTWNEGMTIKLVNAAGTNVSTGTVKGLTTTDDGIVEFSPKDKKFVKTVKKEPVKNVGRIRFLNHKTNTDLMINEFEVYDESGTNVALTATASSSSVHHADYGIVNLNDGKKAAGTQPFHSLHRTDDTDWAELTFDTAVNVKKVVIINRSDGDGSQHRINDILNKDHLEFYDTDDILLHVSPPILNSAKKTKFEYSPGEIIGRWIIT